MAILWWSIPAAGQSFDPPAELQQALAQQAAEDRERDQEQRRSLRTLTQPTRRAVEVVKPRGMVRAFEGEA